MAFQTLAYTLLEEESEPKKGGQSTTTELLLHIRRRQQRALWHRSLLDRGGRGKVGNELQRNGDGWGRRWIRNGL